MRLCLALLLLILPTLSRGEGLKDCVIYALEHNPKVRAQMEQIRVREAEAEVVLSQFFPSIYWNMGYTRSGGSGIPPQDLYSHSFEAEWEIFSGFSTVNSYRASLLERAAENATLREVMLDVALDVVKAYVDALSARYQLKSARHYLESARYSLKLARGRFETGLAPWADVLHAKAKVAEARLKVVENSRRYDIAVGRLLTLMGKPVTEEIELEEEHPVMADFSINDLIAQAINNDPKVKALQLKIKAQKRRIASVKGEFVPKVSLYSSYGMEDESLFPDDRSKWSFGFKVRFPIFTGLSTWKRLKVEKARENSLYYDLKEAELQVQQNIWSAYQQYVKAKEKVVSARSYWDAAKEDFRIMRKKYSVGLASIVDLSTSQWNLYDAESSYYTAITELIYAYYRLVRYVGKIPAIEGL